MDRIDVKTGYLCNNSCLFCVQAHNKGKGREKSTEQIIGILEESREKYEAVVLTGGEVSIRNDIFDIVAVARDLGYKKIHIQSNGRRFYYKDFCRKMIEAGANEFGLALHGHIPELHDYLTRAPGSFLATLRGIRNLVELGQSVMTNTVITKSNYCHLPDIARVLVSAGVFQYQFAFVHIVGNARTFALSVVPRKTLVAPYAKRGLDVGRAKGVKVMTEAIPYCFMKGYEQYIAETIIPETKIFDAENVIESFTENRRNQGKLKGPPCKECDMCKICEGPWREYPEMFGWDEFEPLRWHSMPGIPEVAFEKKKLVLPGGGD
ncbi:MAG TPA: radical SAM protein [bacterium]|nr:radical SAM protein [bacterium]